MNYFNRKIVYVVRKKNQKENKYLFVLIEKNTNLYISFAFSYPSHKQFDAIGSAIVRLLKLPFTKDNLVSFSLLIQLCHMYQQIADEHVSI